MSQAFSEEKLRQMRNLLPKRKSAETPEKLSDKEQARTRLMDLADRREREGEQFQQTPGELFGAQADSVLHGIPLASEVRAEEQGARRQELLDKQKRLREVRKEIRDITLLLRKTSVDVDGNVTYDIPPGSEDRMDFENQKAGLKEVKAELEGKPQKSPAPKTMSLQEFVQDFTREEGREPTEEELEFFRQQGYWR